MARVTEAHIDARIAEILGAAERVFARKGYFPSTMQDIANEANLSAGAMYRYFAGKEAIIEALSDARSASSADTIAGVARTSGASLEAFAQLATAFFARLKPEGPDDPGCIDIELWSGALRNEHVRAATIRSTDAVIVPLTALLRQAQQQGDIAPHVHADALARILYATFDGLVVQISTGQPVDVDACVDALVAMFSGEIWQNRRAARRIAAAAGKVN